MRRGVMDPLKQRKMDDALVKMTVAMNRPFDDVENHFFRKVLFTAEPNFIVPGRKRLASNSDSIAEKVKELSKLFGAW